MNNLKSCPFCVIINNTHSHDCYFTLISRAKQYDSQYPRTRGMVKPTEKEIDDAWNRRPSERSMKEAFLAGMDCYEHVEKTGIPQEDAFDQWLVGVSTNGY